jgi:hypothetical protein
MVIRRNAAPRAPEPEPEPEATEPKRKAMRERVKSMGGSHVAAGIGAGALGNVLGVIAVGQGWLGPKTTAGLMVGTGVAASAAGYAWSMDHMMAAGVGLTAAGTFSFANQAAIYAYEADERKAKEKAEKEAKEKAEVEKLKKFADAQRQIAEAQKVLQGQQQAAEQRQGLRNGPQRLVIVEAEPDDDDDDIEFDAGVHDDDDDDDDDDQEDAA